MKMDLDKQGAIPSLTPNEIIHALSGIDEFENLIVYEFSRKPSPSITHHDMRDLANVVEEYLKDDACLSIQTESSIFPL